MVLSTTEKKKIFFEQQALLILKHKYPERFSGLQHVGYDKSPDLQDPNTSVGIEVTTVLIYQECCALFNMYYGKKVPEDSKEKVDSILQSNLCQFHYDEDDHVECMYAYIAIDLSPAQVSEIAGEPIISTGQKKIDKLNKGHYDRFNTNGLFMFTSNNTFPKTIGKNVAILARYQKEKEKKFDVFYVFRSSSPHDTLYAFNKDGICIDIQYLSNSGILSLQAEEIAGLYS